MKNTPFALYTDNDDFVLVRDGDPAQMLRVHGLPELLRLRARLNQFVDTQEPDGDLGVVMPETAWLSTGQARALAQQRGTPLALSTLISACERGSIEQARKEASHWTMPRWAFDRWFENWNPRKNG